MSGSAGDDRGVRVTMMSGPPSEAPPAPRASLWQRIVALNERLWDTPSWLVEQVGVHVQLFAQAMFWLTRPPFRWAVLFEAMEFIGVQSLLIVSMIGAFVGMVFALQLVSSLRQFGAEGFVGATLGLAVTRELAPVFTAIVVAARAGAGMATELGSMRITEQIDALSTMAVNPVQYLITPRVVGATIMVPLLAVVFIAMAMAGGYGVAVWLENVDRGVFVENARWIVDTADLVQGLVKATVFGATLSLISCTQGFFASGGAKGVGIGTTRAVVGSFVTILVLDYFLSDIILMLQHK
jgi:phospholipid/cholesterol/gamma-HCH transport system permease protein